MRMSGLHDEGAEAPKYAARFFLSGAESLRDDDIRKYFSKFGEVVEANLLVDKKTKRPRGIGFVSVILGQISDIAAFEAAKETIMEQDHTINGVELELSEAMPKPPKKEEGELEPETNDFFNPAGAAAQQAVQQEPEPQESEEEKREAMRNQKQWELHFLQMAMMGTPNPDAFGKMGEGLPAGPEKGLGLGMKGAKGKGKGKEKGKHKGRPGPY